MGWEWRYNQLVFCFLPLIVIFVQLLSRVQIFVTPWTAARQASPRRHSNSCPLSWWCHPTISFSVIPFSSYSQSFPASGSFPVGQLLTSSGQSIGASASASVFPVNIQGWFHLGWTGLTFLSLPGCSWASRVCSIIWSIDWGGILYVTIGRIQSLKVCGFDVPHWLLGKVAFIVLLHRSL